MKVLHSICTIFAPMKARNILILILGTLILPIYLTSCGVDRWKEYAGQTQTDRWIDDTMRVWYYWVDAIPHTNDLNYFQAPFTFFASLKSEETNSPPSTVWSASPLPAASPIRITATDSSSLPTR